MDAFVDSSVNSLGDDLIINQLYAVEKSSHFIVIILAQLINT